MSALGNWKEGPASRMKRVGYWMSEKKIRRLNFGEFVKICRFAYIELVKLDLDKSLEDQGPFDVIIHKITDLIGLSAQGDEKARAKVLRLQAYVDANPELVVLDPTENVRKLLDRHTQYKLATKANSKANRLSCDDESLYFTPWFAELTSLDVETNKKILHQFDVSYPFVCKPSIAHGSSESHQMAIIFNEAGLKDIKPPCVAQTFVNHNAVLYKIFIIGDQYFVVERPSLKNFKAGDQTTIFFDSHDVSKANSASFLNELDDGDEYSQQMAPEPQKMIQLTKAIQAKFKLDLFGIDVIIENNTGRYAVVDINAFPGYDGVPDFFQVLLRLIQRSIHPDQILPAPPTFHPAACSECSKSLPTPANPPTLAGGGPQPNTNGTISYRTITHINGFLPSTSDHHHHHQPHHHQHHHHHSHHLEKRGHSQNGPSEKVAEKALPNGLAMVGRNHNVFNV